MPSDSVLLAHSWYPSRAIAGWFSAGSCPGVLCVSDSLVHQDAKAAKETVEDHTGSHN